MSYAIGDVVWLPRAAPRQVKQGCPVCFGNLSVTVTLGNGEPVIVPCDYCGKGWEGPRGFVLEYEHTPAAERVTITGVVTTAEGVTYQRGEHWDLSGFYGTEAEAVAAAALQIEREKQEEIDRKRYRKNGTLKSATWEAGYHRREAAEHERKAAWHRSRAATRSAPPGGGA